MIEVERLHKESFEFVNEYIAKLNSVLIPHGEFHREREIELLGENISEADEEGRLNIQWEE